MKTLHIKESPGGFNIMINGVLNRRVSRDEIEAIRPGLQALAFLLNSKAREMIEYWYTDEYRDGNDEWTLDDRRWKNKETITHLIKAWNELHDSYEYRLVKMAKEVLEIAGEER